MDLSKLNQNEKWAVYGAIASVVGPILAAAGFGFGVGIFTLLLALAMLAIVFMPQWSPQTTLPGSKGSLMLVVGGIAAVSAAASLLSGLNILSVFGSNVVFVLGWLIGIAGGLLMGYAAWQEFQAEGGKFEIGAPAGNAASSSASAPSSSESSAPPPPAPAASASEAPAQSPSASDPAASADTDENPPA
ncbi:MAG TPA: hypothetical protein VHR55_09740 [Candidatus Limnocylindria bacterium]|nr:hypothetical protein [Candidatus Limnocylindria bacterium]